MNRLLILFVVSILLSSCAGGGDAPAGREPPAALEIISPAFAVGASIPMLYSCQGEDISPALEWSAPPQGTKSLALVMDDPDAPLGTWVHWVVFNLPPGSRGLPEKTSTANGSSSLPAGAIHGENSWGREGYGGPCPPSGTHRYFFRLYALDILLEDRPLDKAGLLKAIDGHILAQGEFFGTYAK